MNLINTIIDTFFIGLFVFAFGFIIYYNVTEICKARKRLREAERNREKLLARTRWLHP
jgi:hypothetical protein